MTKPRQPAVGRAAGSQVSGEASSSPYAGNPEYAWNVNFNNGNSNYNHRDNKGFVRAVRGPSPRASEWTGAAGVSLRCLYDAWRAARRSKKPSANQLDFESQWIDRLIGLQEQLQAGTWSPRPSTCFIAKRPKAREIHAPDFADRVVHHWLVPQLEAIFEPGFIHDSYSNRRGKGTHAAVEQLKGFVRQVYSGQCCASQIRFNSHATEGESNEHREPNRSRRGQLQEGRMGKKVGKGLRRKGLAGSGSTDQGDEKFQIHRIANAERRGGWYLQLDVHNFFNSIHRPTLHASLRRRLQAVDAPAPVLHTVQALLEHPPLHAGVRHRSTAAERALVPAHKRLENADPGCGLPIGNLSSQFFANVYLDALDQFVKRELRVKRYIRYVDDFVLVHESREQLQAWQARIERFLRERLRLKLKPETRLRPLTAGIDFLGYVILPTHVRVRRRVVAHARAALTTWAHAHIHRGGRARATPAAFRQARATWASYAGHFRHAAAWRLQERLRQRFPWVPAIAETRCTFSYRLEGRQLVIWFKEG